MNSKNNRSSPLRNIVLGVLVVLTSYGAAWADFAGYTNYANPDDQYHVVLPEITGGWFCATDYFPDHDNGQSIGTYRTAGRALAANGKYIYLQKNYGAGAGSDGWSPSSAHGKVGINLPGGHDNWIIVAEVTPGDGYGSFGNMDPSFIHISPDGQQVALGMGYNQPMLVFPVSLLDPDNPPLLNSGSGGTTPASGVSLFPWGSAPIDGVQYYEAEWVPDPDNSLATLPNGELDPTHAYNNTFLAINTDRSWSSSSHSGDGSQVELLDTSDSSNRPVIIISEIGTSPNFSASADLTVDLYGNLITGQGHDYNTGHPETGQLKIFAADDWKNAYNGDPENPTPIPYDSTTNIVADTVLSAAALGVDHNNNLHVGGGDVLNSDINEIGYAALIHSDALVNALADSGPISETDITTYKELQPDANGDDSATFVVYNPGGAGLVVVWNPVNEGNPSAFGYDGWAPGVQPIATTYYDGEEPDQDGDGIPDGSDNAYLTPNPGQEDTDGDGWANAVDADFNNSDTVDYQDYLQFKSQYGSSGESVYDMNSNGSVEYGDYLKFKGVYGSSAPWY
ncbi:MAG: hypothetical protein CSA20_01970 [Deltaproteobacteria bacterium]|nr:MAG: hypothetical protein CSA20_01970 [Deltaproteobacteria bacterium]